MGVGAPRAPVGGWGPRPPKSFSMGFNLLDNCYLENQAGDPTPLKKTSQSGHDKIGLKKSAARQIESKL